MLVCAAVEAYALSDRSQGEPRNHDIRRYVLGEIYDNYRVEERFLVKSDGFSSLTIYPRPASPDPDGAVTLDLRDMTDDQDRSIKRVSVATTALATSSSFTLRFPPQPSRYHEYVLVVTIKDGSDGQGIGLLASRGGGLQSDSYEDPVMFINGRRQFGNLVFDTAVDGATSNFGSITSQMGQGGIPAPRLVLLLVLIAKYAALTAVIRAFVPQTVATAPVSQGLPSLPA